MCWLPLVGSGQQPGPWRHEHQRLLPSLLQCSFLGSQSDKGFYPFCILLRLFKTFSLQPRLAATQPKMGVAALW